MHEIGMMKSVVKVVNQKQKEEHFTKVNSINLEVDDKSHISPESLELAFEVLKGESAIFKDAKLNATFVNKGDAFNPEEELVVTSIDVE